MEPVVTRLDPAAAAAAVAALLPHEPDLPYANLPPLARRPEAARALHAARWSGPGAIGIFVAHDAGQPVAAVRADPRPFESAHFGLRMAKLERPAAVAGREARPRALRAAYAAAFAALRAEGWAHVAARASTADRAAHWVLQELGAFHVDTQVSWLSPLTGERRPEAPPDVRVEIFEREAIREVPVAAWRRLIDWAAHAFDRGPLVFDHTLPYERACAVYAVWTEKVATGEWADAIIIVRDRDEVVAFNSVQDIPDVSAAAGVPVIGRGLGATLPEYRGLFTAIQCAMIATPPLAARYLENETQVSTIGSINAYARLGNRFLRSTSTFHLRLDGRWPR